MSSSLDYGRLRTGRARPRHTGRSRMSPSEAINDLIPSGPDEG